MARILGIDIPQNKRALISLTYIYGIGLTTSKNILKRAALGKAVPDHLLNKKELLLVKKWENQRIQDMTKEDFSHLTQIIMSLSSPNSGLGVEQLLLGGDLKKFISDNIKNTIEIGSYVGLRHRRGLPVRGQRTQTNARTRKGPRKTVANKKIESK